jgi:hydroxymethylglutaryl-CoA synthase
VGAYLPYRRVDLSEVQKLAGAGGRKGLRAAASFDEDATTMAVEAGRAALAAYSGPAPESLWFSTANPPYLDRTNANVVHAALRLDRRAPAYDVVGSVRGTFAALRAAVGSPGPAMVVASDLRTGLPGGPDEAYFGDGAGALIVADDADAPVLAEILAWTSVSEEFVDRWRTPGDTRSKTWEERFGEVRYAEVGGDAIGAVLKEGMKVDEMVDDLALRVGNTGAAHPVVLLAAALETAVPGELIALVGLADGAEALVLRTTEALAEHRPARPVSAQLTGGGPLAYGRYLAWRGLLPVEPPRRPEPARVSASAAARSADWKYGLVGSRSADGTVSMPPAIGDPDSQAMASANGTVRTFTIDRLSYTPSPPMVFAVVDFDGGGRLPVELTDVDASEVAVGDRVEMTFRRLSSTDGIHNYFWKARPIRGGEEGRA